MKSRVPELMSLALAGRMVHSETSYLVHKDVLADLVHRYTSVRRIRAHGGSLGSPTVFDELDAKALQNSISLCFPRVALAWQWLTGQRLPPSSTVCCHQECHWEEMFKVGGTENVLHVLNAWTTRFAWRACAVALVSAQWQRVNPC